MVFLVFIGFLYPPPAWNVFSFRPEKIPKRFSSGVVVYVLFFSGVSEDSMRSAFHKLRCYLLLTRDSSLRPQAAKRLPNGVEKESKTTSRDDRWTQILTGSLLSFGNLFCQLTVAGTVLNFREICF